MCNTSRTIGLSNKQTIFSLISSSKVQNKLALSFILYTFLKNWRSRSIVLTQFDRGDIIYIL